MHGEAKPAPVTFEHAERPGIRALL